MRCKDTERVKSILAIVARALIASRAPLNAQLNTQRRAKWNSELLNHFHSLFIVYICVARAVKISASDKKSGGCVSCLRLAGTISFRRRIKHCFGALHHIMHTRTPLYNGDSRLGGRFSTPRVSQRALIGGSVPPQSYASNFKVWFGILLARDMTWKLNWKAVSLQTNNHR
jgi:hypothetical protein